MVEEILYTGSYLKLVECVSPLQGKLMMIDDRGNNYTKTSNNNTFTSLSAMTLFESSMELSEAVLDDPLSTLVLFDDAIQRALADIYKNHQEKEEMVLFLT